MNNEINYKVGHSPNPNMRTLDQYDEAAQKIILYYFSPEIADGMLRDEDARAFFVYYLQLGDWRYDPERCGNNIWGYRKRVARWAYGKYCRKMAKQTHYHLFSDLEMEEVAYDPSNDAEEAEERVFTRQFIGKLFADAGLTPLQKQILRLRYYEELTNYEIGDIVGRSAAQVSTIACEGLRRLKERARA